MPYPLADRFRDFVRHERLFTKEDRLLLACSGGLDSTVLAHLLHAEGYDFALAHMNFQLRGEASDGDAAFVKELAGTLGARFYCKAVNVAQQAPPGESTQMTCRRLRYEWFHYVKRDDQYAYLLTAHHLDDGFETFLMQTIRGSNYSGPGSIHSKPDEDVRRPLTDSSRKEIADYAAENNINWREDASNATDDYLRNRVRHQLTPLLRDAFGHSVNNWRKTQRQILMDHRLREYGLQALRQKFYAKDGENLRILRTDNPHVDLLLREAASVRGFTPEQRRQMLVTNGNAEFSSGRWRARVSREAIDFSSSEGTMPAPLETIRVGRLPFYAERVGLELLPRPARLDEAGVLYLAPPSFPLHLRVRQNGDRFRPLGLNGRSKKVKDYLIDAKVPVWLRDRLYLLTDAHDEIMAICGYCIAEKFKVLPGHPEVLRVTTVG